MRGDVPIDHEAMEEEAFITAEDIDEGEVS